MKLSSQIAFQRAIETEAKSVATETLSILLKTVDKVFRKFSRKKTIVDNLKKLAKLDLLSVRSSIETISVELGKEAAKHTYAKTRLTRKDVFGKQGISGTIPEMLSAGHKNDLNLLINETSRLLAEGHDNATVHRALVGTKGAKHTDGIVGQIAKRQDTLAKTSSKISEQVGMEKARKQDPEIIGYVWVSVLDSVTSLICMDLAGKEFYYASSGEKPLPPQHYNCRSSTGYIHKTEGYEKQPKTFNEWAEKNPKDAKEAMGSTRYKLYKDGGVKIQRFTDLKAEPLTLNQLKVRNKHAFKKADID